MKGLITDKLPWMRCLAHTLVNELAIKDALTGSYFDLIDEMLLRPYYLLREKSQEVSATRHHRGGDKAYEREQFVLDRA